MDLMPRPYTLITFQQNGTDVAGKARVLGLKFDFVHEFEAEDCWADLTKKGKITLPKNIYAVDINTGRNVGLAGTTKDKFISTIFQRGDAVTITYGYIRTDAIYKTQFLDATQIFTGYISKVTSKKPITLEVEDNMWLLKQIACPPQVWPGNKTAENLLRSLLAPYNATVTSGKQLTVNALTDTTIGAIEIQNESVAQLLARLRHEYHLEAYFRGNELRIGSQVYLEEEAINRTFIFQQNIISDELDYQKREDIRLSLICESCNDIATGKTNAQGEEKTKKERLTVLIYPDINPQAPAGPPAWKYIVKKKDVELPANEEGERRTLLFKGITDPQLLANKGADYISKFYYTGFKGKFTTFAVPYVKQGDNVNLFDPQLPDRNGVYKVKSVHYHGGVTGHKQVIELDYKMFITNGKVITPPAPIPVRAK